MKLQVCAHIWNYHRLGNFFLSSFVLHPPKECEVKVTICYCEEDEGTVSLLDYFGGFDIENVEWDWHAMERGRLMRRAIGRNEVALSCEADFLLFSDCDYLFYDRALDQLAQKMTASCEDGPKMMYPRIVMSSADHDKGDKEIDRVQNFRGLYEVNRELYTPQRIRVAIGGVQYVNGETARLGYLPHNKKFQAPEKEWRQTREDKHYRGWLAGAHGVQSVNYSDIETIFRIRHSTRGRFDIGVKL